MTQNQRTRAVVAWLAGLGLLAAPLAYAGNVVLPEVLLVVDTSASMQYRIGADVAPLCGSLDSSVPDTKSRWTAVREMIGGTFTNYSCKYVAMPQTPESATPPPQLYQAPICIPGLAHVLGSSAERKPVKADGATYASGSCVITSPGNAGCTGTTMTLTDTVATNPQIPWMHFDLTGIAQGQNWVAGGLTLTDTGTHASNGSGIKGVLVLGNPDPSSAPYDFICAVAGPSRTVLSAPTTLNFATNAQTLFSLTPTGAQALHDWAATHSDVYIGVVPEQSNVDAGCALAAGPATGERIDWFGAGATTNAYLPTLRIQTGVECPGEGPTVHSEAWGVDEVLDPTTSPAGRDGILYVLGPSAKFGLFTTDGVLSKAETAAGGQSYAEVTGSVWGDINIGMASPFLGGTTSEPVTRQDDLAARNATYNQIQAKLQAIQPNNPTPLGMQLADIVSYVGPGDFMDPHFKTLAQDPTNGDPYSACRRRMVAVFTDGGANLHDGYDDARTFAVEQAAKLYAANIPVYVFAVGFPADGSQGPPAADLTFLNQLALAGGTVTANVVATPDAAIKVLAPAIASTAVLGEVFTRPLYTRATGNSIDTQHSFEAISIYDISQPLRTRGVVEQRVFRCTGACKSAAAGSPNMAQVCDIINYQDKLLNRTLPRRIYTHKTGIRLEAQSSNLTAFDLGIGTVGFGPRLSLDTDAYCVTGAPFELSDATARNGYRDHVLDTLYGAKGSCRQHHPLGAISRAQPALLEPADRLALTDPSFRLYAKATVPTSADYSDIVPPGSSGRPTMLFAATHDGLLHAFRTDTNPAISVQDDLTAGDEMWAWLPKFTLGRISQMRLVTAPNASYLGGSITAGHVLLTRSSTSITEAAKQWRAVVIVGAGDAGAGYTALDVTAPSDPRMLWEVAPDQYCFGSVTVDGVTGPNCLITNKFKDMGRSTARPVIASLFYNNGISVAERAVVFLPMGTPAADAGVENLGVEGDGQRGLYILDLATGAIVRKFTTDDLDLGDTETPIPDRAQLGNFWTEVSCFNNTPGRVVNRCFVGDSKGMFWRLDLSSVNPSDWKLRVFFDAYYGTDALASLQLPLTSADRVPILSPPSLASGSGGVINAVFGTGGVDRVATAARKNLVYSLAERFTTSAGGTAAAPHATVNWVTALQDFERFVGPPLVFANNAYWASYRVLQDGSCDVGTSRLWGVRFDKALSPSDPTSVIGVFPDTEKPTLVSANHPYVDAGEYKPSPVDVQPVPSCVGNCAPTDVNCALAAGGQLGGAKPKYQIGVATSGAVQGDYQTPKSNTGTPASVGTISRDIPQPKSTATVTGWDLLLD